MVTLRLFRPVTLHHSESPVDVRVAPLPQHVARAGRLDLDDLRAVVTEKLSAEGPGDHLSQFDDPDAGERSRHADSSLTSTSVPRGRPRPAPDGRDQSLLRGSHVASR